MINREKIASTLQFPGFSHIPSNFIEPTALIAIASVFLDTQFFVGFYRGNERSTASGKKEWIHRLDV